MTELPIVVYQTGFFPRLAPPARLARVVVKRAARALAP